MYLLFSRYHFNELKFLNKIYIKQKPFYILLDWLFSTLKIKKECYNLVGNLSSQNPYQYDTKKKNWKSSDKGYCVFKRVLLSEANVSWNC